MGGVPRIGLAAIILRGDKVLMGLRKGSHQANTWSFPGGHLDFMEPSLEGSVRREVIEETGLEVGRIRYYDLTNDLMSEENKHYVTLFYTCDYIGGEPQLKEPEKCFGWEWFFKNEIPSNLMIPIKNLMIKRYDFLK